MRANLARWREAEWQLGRALYDMISRWKRMGRFAIWMGSYTHLIFLCPSPASHQGGRRNEEQTLLRDHAVLVSSVGFCLLVGCLRCVGYACAYGVRRPPFFQQQKKEAKNAALMRRGGLCTAQIALRVAHHALACEVGCKREVGCETALRAVRDGFIGGSFGMAFCHGFSECLGNVKGIIKKPSHKESKRLKQRSEHPRERNAAFC